MSRRSCGMSFQQLIPIVTLLLIAFVPSTSSVTTFNFTSFSPASISAIKFSGDAFLSDSGDIELTRKRREVRSSRGQAIYFNPVSLYYSTTPIADFTTHFTFTFNGLGNGSDAYKLAFFLSPAPLAGDGMGSPPLQTVIRLEFNHLEGLIHVNSNSLVTAKRSASQCSNAGYESNCLKSFNGRLRGEAELGYNYRNQTLFASLVYQNELMEPLNLLLPINLKKIMPKNATVGFSASTHRSKVIHTISKWEFRSQLFNLAPTPAPSPATARNVGPRSTNTEHSKRWLLALIPCLILVILVTMAVIITVIVRRRKQKMMTADVKMEGEDEDEDSYDAHSRVTVGISIDFSTGPRRFSYAQLSDATNNFSQKLGQGGFGLVYHGTLPDTLEEVAVKRFAKGSRQGKKEFVSEVTVISLLRHRNLVRLIGWCHEQGELLLVYEYMPEGSLDSHLFGPEVMPWAQRMRVGLGLASAVLYLHDECEQCVLHRDIKSSNVMIDSEFNARLGDFGLARLVDHGQDGQTTMVAGTMGYLAPECVITGKASKECDVYSFGIVLLELATGLRASRTVGELEEWLVEWVWNKYSHGALLEGVDHRLGLQFESHEAERMMVVGLWCLHPNPDRRPSIRDAMLVLSFQAELPWIPAKMPVLAFYETPPCGPEAGLTVTGCNRTMATTTSVELSPRSPKDPQPEAWSYII